MPIPSWPGANKEKRDSKTVEETARKNDLLRRNVTVYKGTQYPHRRQNYFANDWDDRQDGGDSEREDQSEGEADADEQHNLTTCSTLPGKYPAA